MAESSRTAKESGTKQAMNDTGNGNHGLIAKQLFLYWRTCRVRNLKVPTLSPYIIEISPVHPHQKHKEATGLLVTLILQKLTMWKFIANKAH